MQQLFKEIETGIRAGRVIPYLGPGALSGVSELSSGEPMPAEGEALILALNNGRAMSPRLMYEFSRAAMSIEQRRGRAVLELLLTQLYQKRQWSASPLHQWLAELKPRYMVDINRDTQLQQAWSTTPHILMMGTARMMGGPARYRTFLHDGSAYAETPAEQLDWTLPVLFKPMGSPLPEPNYIASDADYVDYITELMGGFALPTVLKQYRKDKQYLLLGLRLTRDTERMVFSEISIDAGSPAGWALIPDPTPKERRYCERKGLVLVEADAEEFLAAVSGLETAEV